MTDRQRPSKAGSATKILATGVSVAAGLGLMGLIEASAQGGGASVGPEAADTASAPATIIRRVIVPPTDPDILLQSSMGESKIVIQEAPAPIVRNRVVGGGGSAPARSAPAQSTSGGS